MHLQSNGDSGNIVNRMHSTLQTRLLCHLASESDTMLAELLQCLQSQNLEDSMNRAGVQVLVHPSWAAPPALLSETNTPAGAEAFYNDGSCRVAIASRRCGITVFLPSDDIRRACLSGSVVLHLSISQLRTYCRRRLAAVCVVTYVGACG